MLSGIKRPRLSCGFGEEYLRPLAPPNSTILEPDSALPNSLLGDRSQPVRPAAIVSLSSCSDLFPSSSEESLCPRNGPPKESFEEEPKKDYASPDSNSKPKGDEFRIGTRVAIYWDGEDEYFKATVTKTRKHDKPYFVQYDDGDKEWINFANETYLVLPGKKTKSSPRHGKTDDTKSINSSNRQETSSWTSLKKEMSGGEATKTSSSDAIRLSLKRKPTAASSEESWVMAGLPKPSGGDSTDSETDEEEIMQWAVTMFGISPRPVSKPKVQPWHIENLHDDVRIPISEAVKLGRRRRSCQIKGSAPSSSSSLVVSSPVQAVPTVDIKRVSTPIIDEEELKRRRKEESRPLSSVEVKKLLTQDLCPGAVSEHWVRRSMRQPSRSALNSPHVKALMDKLRSNDTDMIVLKMKKYLPDPATPQIVIDAVLDALEDNTNCEALYFQNFNEGMRDEQVLHLVEVLKRPSCKIWCLNIGETYKVKTSTWEKFTEGLKHTKITHMYASEHTITTALKEQIRSTIRDNRSKHSMHIDPANLDTIVQCTHCWWNPINAKRLSPYLTKEGYEHMLHDKEGQGLRGTTSGALLT